MRDRESQSGFLDGKREREEKRDRRSQNKVYAGSPDQITRTIADMYDVCSTAQLTSSRVALAENNGIDKQKQSTVELVGGTGSWCNVLCISPHALGRGRLGGEEEQETRGWQDSIHMAERTSNARQGNGGAQIPDSALGLWQLD